MKDNCRYLEAHGLKGYRCYYLHHWIDLEECSECSSYEEDINVD
jgi:hypothetical protein